MLFSDLHSGQLYAIQSSAVGSSCGAQTFAVAKVENALNSSILVEGDDVIVCNGAAYGLPTFRLVDLFKFSRSLLLLLLVSLFISKLFLLLILSTRSAVFISNK